jgi:acetyltransferase-like isoleucine patch superfamily enzyme
MKKRILFAVTMACINASVISFTLTAYNTGFPDDFLSRWGVNFLIAFSIVVPSIVFIGPHVHKLIDKMFS